MPLPSKASTANETAPAPSPARPEAQRLGGGQLSPAASAWVQQPWLVAVAAVTGVLGVAALSYWWTKAPLYNPPGTVDPWLYTALFVNFDYIYEHFGNTYYASRLPWIVPGRIVYGVLPVDAAYWVLHGLAFVGGVACVFALIRRHLGVGPAVVGAATLALSAIYWNAQYWDYIDGISLTYLAAGLYFGLPLSTGSRRAASLVAAGIFMAAAVTTNLFVGLVVLIYPIAYVFLQPATGLRPRVSLAAKDALALGLGAADLVAVLGVYSRIHGGGFLFFDAQIDVIRSGVIASYKLQGYEWLRAEPRLLVPIFLVIVAIPLLVLGRRLPPFRFAAGSVGGLAFLTAFIYGWEFLAGGSVLEYQYYFSYFSISIALAMASVTSLAVSLVRSRWAANAGAAVAATIAGVIALGLIYQNERVEWTGQSGMRISAVIMAVATLLILGMLATRHRPVGAVAVVVAVGAVAFASHFAINSSTGTLVASTTARDNRSLYHAGLDLVTLLNRSVAHETVPAFWYPAAARSDFASIQSLYYFGYTYLSLELPKVTRDMRNRLDLVKPTTIVMLCETRGCGGGAAALRRSGYSYAEESATLIARGRVRLWAVLLRAT